MIVSLSFVFGYIFSPRLRVIKSQFQYVQQGLVCANWPSTDKSCSTLDSLISELPLPTGQELRRTGYWKFDKGTKVLYEKELKEQFNELKWKAQVIKLKHILKNWILQSDHYSIKGKKLK